MDLVTVDKKKFCHMAVEIFKDIKHGIIVPNIFNIIRVGLLTCKRYSQEVQVLHTGAISVLVVESMKDVIRQLKKNEIITKGEYTNLVTEYNLLRKELLIACVNEIMIIVNSSS